MINGDNISGKLNKFLYFKQCLINHKKGTTENIKIKKISLNNNINNFEGSPARILSNLFWSTIDWSNLTEELGDKIHFMDLGCGSGSYYTNFLNITNEDFGSYMGIDIYKHNDYPANLRHILDSAENAHKYLEDKTNTIVSQSALEHIEKDFETIDNITETLIKSNKKFIQIHIIPASSTLWTYLFHGWRQYSLKNIGYIFNILHNKYEINTTVVPIGGWRSFLVHLRYITFPTYVKRQDWSDNKKSNTKIMKAVSNELSASGKIATFWVLLISSKDVSYKLNNL